MREKAFSFSFSRSPSTPPHKKEEAVVVVSGGRERPSGQAKECWTLTASPRRRALSSVEPFSADHTKGEADRAFVGGGGGEKGGWPSPPIHSGSTVKERCRVAERRRCGGFFVVFWGNGGGGDPLSCVDTPPPLHEEGLRPCRR